MTTPPTPPRDPVSVSWRVWLVFGASCMVLLSTIMFSVWVLPALVGTGQLPRGLVVLVSLGLPVDVYVHDTYIMVNDSAAALAALFLGFLLLAAIIGLWWSVAVMRRARQAPTGWDPSASENSPPSTLHHRPSS